MRWNALGSHCKIKLNVRIIAASNKDLRQLVDKGQFRQDLFYRLDVLPLSWPALRERRDDILPLAEFFLQKYGAGKFLLSSEARQMLTQYSWPGNVRELENAGQRALVMARGMEVQAVDLNLPVALQAATAMPVNALKHTKKPLNLITSWVCRTNLMAIAPRRRKRLGSVPGPFVTNWLLCVSMALILMQLPESFKEIRP